MKNLKFNNKILKRLAITGVALITATTFTACKVNGKEVSTSAPIAIEEIKEEITTPQDSVITEDIISIKEDDKSLLESLSKNPVSIENTTDYMLNNMNSISPVDDITTDEELLIASYAYQKIIGSGIDNEKALKELYNMMIEQIVPRCLSDEDWEENFGILNSTLGETESLQDTYFVLAYLLHNDSCNEKHELNENYAVSCKVLEEGFQKKYSK